MPPGTMNIDITTVDLLSNFDSKNFLYRWALKQRFEAQKKLLLDHFVNKKAILSPTVVGEEENNAPEHLDGEEENNAPEHLDEELLLQMVRVACVGIGGIVYVRAPADGTSHACAKFVLKNSVGGIMFRNCKDESGIYWKGVARAMGIPKNIYENNKGWRWMLALAVASAEDIKPKQSTWWDKFLEMCGAESKLDSDDDMPEMLPRGIIIFGDFNDIQHDEDILFMTHFLPLLSDLQIMAFVLVSDQETANSLVDVSGERISDLERFFPREPNFEVLDEVLAPVLERAKK